MCACGANHTSDIKVGVFYIGPFYVYSFENILTFSTRLKQIFIGIVQSYQLWLCIM
jgi:hypothetical protein